MKLVHGMVVDSSPLYQEILDRIPGLRFLASKYLNIQIQGKSHDSVIDAKIALSLIKLRIQILDEILQFDEKEVFHF